MLDQQTNNGTSKNNTGSDSDEITPSEKNQLWKSNLTKEERVNLESWISFKNTFKEQITEVSNTF